jgi:hypothetical protein
MEARVFSKQLRMSLLSFRGTETPTVLYETVQNSAFSTFRERGGIHPKLPSDSPCFEFRGIIF